MTRRAVQPPEDPQAKAVVAWPCLSEHPQGAVLAVSVVPNGRRTQVLGLHGETLRLRLAAPPVDGKANELLVAWLAGELGLPRQGVTVLSGEHARRKRLLLPLPAAQLVRWLAAVLPPC